MPGIEKGQIGFSSFSILEPLNWASAELLRNFPMDWAAKWRSYVLARCRDHF
jgi:hypothetical protein